MPRIRRNNPTVRISLSVIAVSFLLPILAATGNLGAQQNVQPVFQLATELTFPPVTGWKASKGEVLKGENPGLNDKDWEEFQYQPVLGTEECWFRVKLKLPRRIALQDVEGREVRLYLDVRSPGELYIDGARAASLSVGDNRVRLTSKADPGHEYSLAVHLKAVHQQVVFRQAQLELPEWKEAVDAAADLRLTIYAAYRLLGTDTHQRSMQLETDPGTDRSSLAPERRQALVTELDRALGHVDRAAVEKGRPQDFSLSVKSALADMPEVAGFMRGYRLYLVSNAHIDLAWLWRWRETVEAAHDTFESVLALMRKYPELTFSQSQAQLYEWMRQYYPDTFAEIGRRVKEGRWEIVGGMWVEPDCNLISGESWVRQILLAKDYFRKFFGLDIKLGWNPDSFGYNWNMPQFFSRAGIGAFVTQKLLWNDTNIFPYHLFWWRGPDGSRILVYMPYSGYTNVVNPYQMLDDMRQFEANTGGKDMAVLIGYGDHGGGPDEDMLLRARHLKELSVFPRVEFGRMDRYLAAIPDSVKKNLPEWDNELYLEYHRGTFTSQAAMKRDNRELENSLESAEKAASLDAILDGSIYPAGKLESAWKKVLFNQMHDILPGSGITANYRDAEVKYAQARELSENVSGLALSGLSSRIATDKGPAGTPLVVFNSLSWPRSSIVCWETARAALEGVQVYDPQGRRVPCQVVETGDELRASLLFRSESVPATGYKVYRLRQESPARGKTDTGGLTVTRSLIENGRLRVEINPASGLVTRVYDKKAGREVLSPGGRGNLIQLFEDRPKQWDAWNIGYTGKSWSLEKADKVEVVESGPVRATVRITRSFLGPTKPRRPLATSFPSSFFTTELSLYRDEPQLEVRCRIDWWEDQVLTKAAWELNVKSDTAYYEIPMAAIGRPTTRLNDWDKARFEVPGLRWADLSEGTYGVSLLSRSKYGYDTEGSRLRLTLLKAPIWPDPSADRGTHEISYAIYPHTGDWRQAGTVNAAAEFCTPFILHEGVNHHGSLPGDSLGFLAASPANVVVSAFKAAEDGRGYVLRCYESTGKACRATVSLPPDVRKVRASSPMEEEGEELSLPGGGLTFDLGAFEIRTFRLYFGPDEISAGAR